MTKSRSVITVLIIILLIIAGVIFAIYQKNEKGEYEDSPNGQTQTYGNPNGADYQPTPTGTTPVLEGNTQDLVSVSLTPGQEVSGTVQVTGTLKNNYFFEAVAGVAILDANKKVLRQDTHLEATSDWMTTGPVNFKATLNFNGLPKGKAYVALMNDNPSGLPENQKQILIPVIIK
jgi:hypothetical protein